MANMYSFVNSWPCKTYIIVYHSIFPAKSSAHSISLDGILKKK